MLAPSNISGRPPPCSDQRGSEGSVQRVEQSGSAQFVQQGEETIPRRPPLDGRGANSRGAVCDLGQPLQ